MNSTLPAVSVRLACVLALAAVARPLRAQAIAEVQVTPDTVALRVGQRQTLFATAYDRAGNIVPNARFTYWTSDSTVARISGDGTITGVRPGRARVEARAGGRRGASAVVVSGDGGATPAASAPAGGTVLSISPAGVLLMPSETVELVARALREDGTPVNAGRITWRSLRPEVATVDSNGTLVGVADGQTIIQASAAGGLVATIPVEVQSADFVLSDTELRLGPGDVDTLRALVPAQGNREPKTVLQWRSTDTTVVRVGPTGIVRAVGPGTADVVVTGFFQERRARISVYQLPAAFVVSPPATDGPVVLAVGGARKFTAVAEAADSSPIPEARVTWSVGDTGVVGFDEAAGVLTGRAVGRTTLTAQLAGFPPVVWDLQVVPGEIAVAPRRVGLTVGRRDTLRATYVVGSSGSAPAAEVRWRSDRPEVVRVAPNGLIEGVGFGRAIVTATTATGHADSAVVYVGGDLLVTSDRGGGTGIYQLRAAAPDNFVPVLVDSAQNLQPVYSPDRTRIAFSSDREGGDFDIWVMDADGSNLRRVTAQPGADVEPAWLPDGSGLVFAGTRGNATQLWRVGLDGSRPTALTNAPGASRSPAVSPDGRTVVFVSTRDGNPEIYRLDLSTGIESRLTNTPLRESSPRVTASGEVIYAVEQPGRPGGSRVMRLAAGRAPVEIATSTQPIQQLAASPDGAQLAWVAGRPAERNRRAQLTFVLQQAGTPAGRAVRLLPNEQIASPSF